MHINCVICSDLFTPNSETSVTPCGHIFHYHCLAHWMERSKTCPQCRNKVTPRVIHRIYFNVASCEGINEDPIILQNKLDSLEYQMRLKEKELQNLSEKYGKVKKQNEGLRQEVSNLTQTEKAHNSAVLGLKEQVHFFKKRAKDCEKLDAEIHHLKSRIKSMENVELALTGTRKEVEDIIRNETNIESLALLASTLKKSLIDSDRKKRELQKQLNQIQSSHITCEQQISKYKIESQDIRRELEILKENYIKEVQFLKDKYSQLNVKASCKNHSDSLNNSIQRIITESPVNYSRTPVIGKTHHMNVSVDISKSSETPYENISKVSPYLLVKPSGLGLLNSIETKGLVNTNEASKFSIFKQTTSISDFRKGGSSNVLYNGLGGSSKEDIFPSPKEKSVASGIKRKGSSTVSLSKFKKLSANTGKRKAQ
ncbi:E3 ubiquitin-protein ligase TRAIP-like isoform X2 [Cylas formicarius]|uniref:E3 ubiquitin-protein ligase TRAIP-like isoform X2 n=1 Tax=Cylas formicarius TaxID=197179 RepID=UPI002958D974|nr:E3 ubiquitin-protein ligase TRAIP-like isoform X2 [Cylas formicarius]